MAVLALVAPGWGLEQTHKAASALLGAPKIRPALGLCAGFLSFEAGAAPGYSFNVIVPAYRADELRLVLLEEWRACVPCGWVRVLDDLLRRARALEALVELRVRSEQAVLIALGHGEVDVRRAFVVYALETGASSDSAVGGQKHRLVLAPGMRKLAKDIREGRLHAEAAVGDGAAAVDGAPGAQGAAGTAPQPEGMGQAGAIPSTSGAQAVEPCAAGAPGGSAAPEPPPGAAGCPNADDDEGWEPCPWDPTLEMRPSRDPQQPRALPWFRLQKMAERGEVVPILHNGRVVGYRTSPRRGLR